MLPQRPTGGAAYTPPTAASAPSPCRRPAFPRSPLHVLFTCHRLPLCAGHASAAALTWAIVLATSLPFAAPPCLLWFHDHASAPCVSTEGLGSPERRESSLRPKGAHRPGRPMRKRHDLAEEGAETSRARKLCG